MASPPPSVEMGGFMELFREGLLDYRVAVDPRGRPMGERVLMIEGGSERDSCNYARHAEYGMVTQIIGSLRHGPWIRLRLESRGGGRAHAPIQRPTLRQFKCEEGRMNYAYEYAVDYL
jgi:hypothetical protein